MSELRQRKQTTPLESFKELDAFKFNKLPEEIEQKTNIGGTVSILSRLLILLVIYKEMKYYFETSLIFRFEPDVDILQHIKFNLDMTVKMPCKNIGADILDSTNQNTFSFGVIEEEDTWWNLCPEQKQHFDYMSHLNKYLTEEYHSIAEIMYKTNEFLNVKMPPRSIKAIEPYDACRIHGSLKLNKVAGNFHVTQGKSLHFPQGHLHLNILFDDVKANFSHRITKLSFGDPMSGIVQPLEYEEKIFMDERNMIMYFIEIVPTDIETFVSHVKTYQYSVKENIRTIDHDHGSHGMPGIYIKYDVSALKVLVLLGRENIIKLIVRMCSVIAGIIVISSFVNSILLKLWEGFFKTFAPQVYAMSQEKLPLKVDPQKTANIYDVLTKANNETKSGSATNINLLTNNLMPNSDPIITLTTK
ncbi:hypothetical protein PVAND_002325 [Polypedilum vanderplanki]|uniref:Endoplasmic reticulum-Golgi intermediate compartment protein 2 n=1 Tax=Polypedilum vanderplanki TaxID=319348 RepID=A0A9J6BQW4_POLVA|nr:hypothetical protein PVAND_002325 [Polypedilum vanderplanki]